MKSDKKTNTISKENLEKTVFIFCLISLVALILDFGYTTNYWMHLTTDVFYMIFGGIFFFAVVSIFPKLNKLSKHPKGYFAVLFVSAGLLLLAILNTAHFLLHENKGLNVYVAALVFILTILDLSSRLYRLDSQTLHPALVFALSFGVLICIGTLMLMSPKATTHGIDFLDALFTSTSAVCVTGLAVLDTGKDFTLFGQITILVLIQLGALGMLSFTSLFALFFKGFGSYESRLILKEMINSESLNSTFKMLIQIIVVVLLIETIGAVFIFNTIDDAFGTTNQRIFFSVFHSVSAFCNAGFSTLSNSLYEEGFRYNYPLHFILALLIILGGLGYGIIISLYTYCLKWLAFWQLRIFKSSWTITPQKVKPRVTINTKIVLVTTLVLLIVGMFLFYILEQNNSLQKHSTFGKVITSFFGSVTTRTAGFNTVDTGSLSLPTIMIVLLLMWIGASPGSTGGGIKTTTFAIATLNIVQQVFGYKNIRLGFYKIPPTALQRSTAIISLSLIVIGLSTFLLIFFDEQLGVMPIAFECFSAFSTVGLSMGITSQLSIGSKAVIIMTMFVGRVGFLTLLTGLIRQFYVYKYSAIDYPEQEIFIN